MHADAMNPAFVTAGRKAGLEIWRVESFAAAKYPQNDYGKFYTGDSYIILNTRGSPNNYYWDIHFWLGNETSLDESGAAAIMAVELDDSLGGGPIQHREIQEHESALFLSYFPNGIRYLEGGIESGFSHVDPNAVERRLFQVKGKRHVRVRQVELHVRAMNNGDCFILDVGKEVFVYTGKGSTRMERIKAISMANQIRDQDHLGRSQVIVLDSSSNRTDYRHFFSELGSGSPEEVADEKSGGDDEEFEKEVDNEVTLWKVSDASGMMTLTKIGVKPLSQNLLNPDDSFILDTVTSGLFVWIGKGATKAEKIEAMKKAQQFLVDNKYPKWSQIMRVVQDGEPSAFKQYFCNWRSAGDQLGLGKRFFRAVAVGSSEFDPAVLHAKRIQELKKSGGKAYSFMPDDGSGSCEIFRVEDFELAPVAKETHGMFFGGDSYIVKYTCGIKRSGTASHVVYYWLGQGSSIDERACAALHTVRIANELHGRTIQARVTQGHEPRHFLCIFRGKMIVFSGGRHSGFRNLRDHDTYDEDGTRFFQVRGTCADDVRAVQVEEVAASLSSDDVFILESPADTYLWLGKGASESEKQMARTAATRVSPGKSPVELNEGQETDKFWSALGGMTPYNTRLDSDPDEIEARLYHCCIKTSGRFVVEEIKQFKQQDLDQDDIMVLDSGEELYVWVGNGSTEEEKEKSLEMAKGYLKSDPSERSHDLSLIFMIQQGHEPESFTTLFPSWNSELWSTH